MMIWPKQSKIYKYIYVSTNICFIHSVQIGPYYCVHCHKETCSFLTIYTTIVCVAVVYRYFRINWVLGGLNYINTLLLNEFQEYLYPLIHNTTENSTTLKPIYRHILCYVIPKYKLPLFSL